METTLRLSQSSDLLRTNSGFNLFLNVAPTIEYILDPPADRIMKIPRYNRIMQVAPESTFRAYIQGW